MVTVIPFQPTQLTTRDKLPSQAIQSQYTAVVQASLSHISFPSATSFQCHPILIY